MLETRVWEKPIPEKIFHEVQDEEQRRLEEEVDSTEVVSGKLEDEAVSGIRRRNDVRKWLSFELLRLLFFLRLVRTVSCSRVF